MWVHCDDRNPENDGVYLTYFRDADHQWYRIWEDGAWWLHTHSDHSEGDSGETGWRLVPNNSITHWFEKPSPPKL